MSHEQLVFEYDEEPAMQQLIAFLVSSRGQFTVCPYPQDLKHAVRTGWVVSWPKGQVQAVTLAEPSEGPCAA